MSRFSGTAPSLTCDECFGVVVCSCGHCDERWDAGGQAQRLFIEYVERFPLVECIYAFWDDPIGLDNAVQIFHPNRSNTYNYQRACYRYV